MRAKKKTISELKRGDAFSTLLCGVLAQRRITYKKSKNESFELRNFTFKYMICK